MKSYKFYFIILLFLINPVLAKDKTFIKSSFFTYENDSVYGKDGYYSNGLQLYFLTADKEANNSLYNYNYSFGVGQKIFTPKEIEQNEIKAKTTPKIINKQLAIIISFFFIYSPKFYLSLNLTTA